MSGKNAAETPEERLNALGITLQSAPAAAGNYAGFVVHGTLLMVSGQLARRADGSLLMGRAGLDLTIAQGQEAARLSALNILAQAKTAVGDLSRLARLMRLNGFVQSTAEFTDHAQIVNGASDLLASVLGSAGIHSRVAVGAIALPLGSATEIDALFMIHP